MYKEEDNVTMCAAVHPDFSVDAVLCFWCLLCCGPRAVTPLVLPDGNSFLMHTGGHGACCTSCAQVPGYLCVPYLSNLYVPFALFAL